MKINSIDHWHMKSALALARKGLGRVWPNPSVGCVMVKDGHIIGRGRTSDGGRPHAEVNALAMAGDNAKGADVYVTLEPCAHHGETGPCAQALIDAKVGKVIIATGDTDSRVAGKGLDMLRHAGIAVVTGVCEEEARELNKGFFLRHAAQRPLISLKTATTLDAKIATSAGQSKWITGDLARKRGHLLRLQHDAIAVGVNTVLEDNPFLNNHLKGFSKSLVRIIFDTNLRLKSTEKIFDDMTKNPVWIVTASEQTDKIEKTGAKIIHVPKDRYGHVDLPKAMNSICHLGVTRVLIEGGASLITSFLREGLFDALYWFKASSIIGADGLSAVQNIDIENLDQKIQLDHSNQIILGDDMLDIYISDCHPSA